MTAQPREGVVAAPGAVGGALRALSRATDAQLALFISAVLFALAAWPLALVDLPPFQDLPNHLATITVIEHPERYPEFVFNGFFKTNSSLFTWLLFAGKVLGLNLAARSFVLVVLALGAFALPRFVLAFGGRRRMVVAAFFAWPMVHNWFVSMGMLDFALGFALATWLFVLLDAQRQRPTPGRAASIAALALLTWYAHVFPLIVVCVLLALQLAVDLVQGRRRDPGGAWPAARAAIVGSAVPLLPAAALVAWSMRIQLAESAGLMTGYVKLGRELPPWELFYNMWAEWLYGFTFLEIATLVPCIGMGLWAIYRWREDAPFFGPVPLLALAALYFFSPYVATNWFHVNSRFIPFLWLAALVRLPERLPSRALAVLGVCAASYSAGMGVDYLRLRAEWARFAAGIGAVPEGSRLLPLVFRSKEVSDNTGNLLHAWGFYVVEKLTSAPLLFAHSKSFPVTYREAPEPRFNHLVLENFAPLMANPDFICGLNRNAGFAVDDCTAFWRARWAEFWQSAVPKYDHVLLWEAPPAVLALVPPAYHVVFQRDELVVLSR